VAVGICQLKLLVGLLIFAPYATTVAFIQSKVGLIVFHVSTTGTSFHRMACNENATGETIIEMLT
jgi:hypothetical protein